MFVSLYFRKLSGTAWCRSLWPLFINFWLLNLFLTRSPCSIYTRSKGGGGVGVEQRVYTFLSQSGNPSHNMTSFLGNFLIWLWVQSGLPMSWRSRTASNRGAFTAQLCLALCEVSVLTILKSRMCCFFHTSILSLPLQLSLHVSCI